MAPTPPPLPQSPRFPSTRPRQKSPPPGKRFGRANELLKPDEIIVQINSRSIPVSPPPYNVKLEDVQSFFAQYGKLT